MRAGIIVLFLILEKKLQLFYHLRMMPVLCLSFYELAYVEVHYLYIQLVGSFIKNGCWIFFSNYVPASIKKRMWFLSSIFFKCIILTDLQMLNQSYIPERNLLWSWYIIIFFIFWILFACSLLNVFIFMFIRDASLLFSFPVVLLTEFDISVKTGFIKWVWRYSLLFYFFFWTV